MQYAIFGLGTPEVIVIIVVVLLLFGGKKIPELMRGIGQGVREFNSAKSNLKQEIEEYGSRLVKMVARPDVPPRKYKRWNGQLSRGWWKKCDAQEIADRLNDMDDKLVIGGTQ